MLKRFVGFAVIALLPAHLPAFQKPKAEAAPATVLTDEEKEILKNREMLENLELLQDFEKFRFFDLFAASEKPGDSKAKAETKQIKKDEKKKK